MLIPGKTLVLAPHTDDGELGCGGTIAKFCAASAEVHYAAFSLCQKSLPEGFPPTTLENECRAATALLGIDAGRLMFYDFEVRDFDQKRQEILEALVSLNKYVKPELILIPCSSDNHQDHQVIHNEALRAFKNSSVFGYELPWNHSGFHANYFSVLTPQHLEKKVAALQSYISQAHRNYMKDDFVRSLAKVRGVQCNAAYAEAFEVYKMIN
jgi:N-acetylglucosamine malate deacetylase 1